VRNQTPHLRSPNSYFCGCFEILQNPGRLAFAGGISLPSALTMLELVADADMGIALGADRFAPPDRFLALGPAIVFGDGPGMRQGVVDGGDLVVQNVRIGLVLVDALLDDGLVVRMQRNAGAVEVGDLSARGSHLQQIVAAVAVLVDPFAEGIALEHRLHVLASRAVGVDAARVVERARSAGCTISGVMTICMGS